MAQTETDPQSEVVTADDLHVSFWLLRERIPIRCDESSWGDFVRWANWFHDHPEERELRTTLVGPTKVSTVFLGMASEITEAGPLVFETMLFGGPYDGEQWRYATYEEALTHHDTVCTRLTAGEDPNNG